MSSTILRSAAYAGVAAVVSFACVTVDSTKNQDNGTPTTDGGTSPEAGGGEILPGEWEKGYEPRTLVPGTTTPEMSAPTAVEGGKGTKITLSDETAIELPALAATGTGAITTLTLARQSNDVDLSALGEATTGSMRVVDFEAFDPVARGLIAANVAPVLTIPAKEVGSIDHSTISVARIADVMNSGTMTKQVTLLPASWDAKGNLQVRDYLFPDSVASDLELTDDGGGAKTMTRSPLPSGYVPRPRHIVYVAGTFQGAANWARGPKLVRMIPVADAPEKRKPLDRVDATTRERVKDRCFHTAVVLVHGHNEEEGLGTAPATVEEPWLASYKRDVWTHFYDKFMVRPTDECTRLYEFVYPTYRPIFTPQTGRERLDESFARLVASELKPQLDAKIPIKVVILAHSMGGLVARAGVQLFDKPLQAALSDVITWGTPHTGSPLVSLRYAFAAVPGYDARKGLVSIGLDNVDSTLYALRRAIENLQVDSPGTRDLRWAPSATTTPHDLALDSFLELSPGQVERDQYFDLVNGELLYNENLKRLNGEDIYRVADKYAAYYGITLKRAKITWRFGKWFKPTIDVGSDIAIGATALEWLVKDPTTTYNGHVQGASDGAVPVTSAAGAGVVALTRLFSASNVDHEEFFGAPSAPGTFTKPDIAGTVAGDTIWNQKWSPCPVMEFDFTSVFADPTYWAFDAAITWPGAADSATIVRSSSTTLKLLPGGENITLQNLAVSSGTTAHITGKANNDAIPPGVAPDELRASVQLIDGTFVVRDDFASSGCVTASTQVALEGGGTRAIAAVRPGDIVLAYEPGRLGRATTAKVQRVLRHVGSYRIHRLVAGDGVELDVTDNHPILTLEGGYQPVSALVPGDHVFVEDPVTRTFEPRALVGVIRDVSRERVVYNLKTTRGQYVAEGIVVHNKCLAGGSLVETPTGPRAVETILPGERVYTLDHGVRVPTTVTHAYQKSTSLAALPGRALTPHVLATDNHRLVTEDGARVRVGDVDLPRVAITGDVYDLATEAGTYLADGVLVAGGD